MAVITEIKILAGKRQGTELFTKKLYKEVDNIEIYKKKLLKIYKERLKRTDIMIILNYKSK